MRLSISSTAASYSGRFSRLRQSSSVSFQDRSGSSGPALEPAQLLLRGDVHPELRPGSCPRRRGCARTPRSPRTPAPTAPARRSPPPARPAPDRTRSGRSTDHAAPTGQHRPEAPQEVVPLLVVRGRGELRHPHVPWVQRCDQALDRAALAGGVPALEDHAQWRTDAVLAELAAEHQAQVAAGAAGRPRAGRGQPLGQRRGQVDLATAGSCPYPCTTAQRPPTGCNFGARSARAAPGLSFRRSLRSRGPGALRPTSSLVDSGRCAPCAPQSRRRRPGSGDSSAPGRGRSGWLAGDYRYDRRRVGTGDQPEDGRSARGERAVPAHVGGRHRAAPVPGAAFHIWVIRTPAGSVQLTCHPVIGAVPVLRTVTSAW